MAAVALGIMGAGVTQTEAHELTHKVQLGESLWGISNKTNVSIQELMQINNLSSSTIYVGQELLLLAPHSHETTYTVKAGDTLYLISKSYNTTINELKTLNNLSTDTLYVGQLIKIPSGTGTTGPSPTPATSNTHTVQPGETVWRIATTNQLTVDQLRSYNNLSSDMLYVGQVLQLTPAGAPEQPAPTPSVQKTLHADALIAEGKKYLGVPYVWGGITPAGFDCSGFLDYVYKTQGIILQRTVAAIWDSTKSVPSPQKGDIVFYATTSSGPSHAGIYLGDNKFLHAGTSTGVTITDMNNSYWKPRYLGAKSVK
jgi:LysM repeat protein